MKVILLKPNKGEVENCFCLVADQREINWIDWIAILGNKLPPNTTKQFF